MGSIDKKSLKNGSYSMGITAIVIAVLVVINLIVGQIPEKYTQVDVSTQKLYTISDTTVKYLKDMNTDVTIYHIVQSGKEDSVLEKMLTRYEEESKHIKVEKKDPVLYPNFTSQYTSDDVADNSLIVVAGEKSKVISYSDLYETEMDYTTYQTNTTGFDGEGQIDSAISYVTSENLPVIYTLEGHEELELNSSLTDSRAEYRLLLRQDNADLRLRKKGYQVGLIDEETYQAVLRKEEAIQKEIERTEHATIGGTPEVQKLLEEKGSTLLKSGTTIAELIRRPELNYEDLAPIDKERPELSWDVKQQVEINLKYEGYIKRQLKQVEQFKKLEAKKIPEDLDYEKVGSLRIEVRQKLEEYRPISIGQASRISGVSPADISVLLVYLEQYRRNSNS